MQKLFEEVNTLDRRCYEQYGLSEDILMDHAANSMAAYIQKNVEPNKSLLIVCGMGNNGADGITLARLLYPQYRISLFIPFGVKSPMAQLQLQRVQKIGIHPVEQLMPCDVIVDCLFGSGLNRDLDELSIKLIQKLNSIRAFKIACDIPSGINQQGQITSIAFKANMTITMGALKTALYSDEVKDYVGKIKVASLGVDRTLYESESNIFLLDPLDIQLPLRMSQSTNKGDFGHLAVVVGMKKGAGVLACEAAFAFGCSLVSAITHENLDLPYHIMQSHKLPCKASALALGMGLGNCEANEIESLLLCDLPKVIDADIFYHENIKSYLKQGVVITPHPKEFCSVLKLCDIVDIEVDELQKNRFQYALMFSAKYPEVVLYLKGANSIIAYDMKLYVNALGSAVLSKGGSGDVLSGLIGSLLAQGYDPLNATISASIAHTLAANSFEGNNYALTPQDIIQKVKTL